MIDPDEYLFVRYGSIEQNSVPVFLIQLDFNYTILIDEIQTNN